MTRSWSSSSCACSRAPRFKALRHCWLPLPAQTQTHMHLWGCSRYAAQDLVYRFIACLLPAQHALLFMCRTAPCTVDQSCHMHTQTVLQAHGKHISYHLRCALLLSRLAPAPSCPTSTTWWASRAAGAAPQATTQQAARPQAAAAASSAAWRPRTGLCGALQLMRCVRLCCCWGLPWSQTGAGSLATPAA